MNVASSVSPPAQAKLRELVDALDAAAARAEGAAATATGTGLDRWFQGVVGTESTAAAARSLAHSARQLATAVRGKVERLRTDAEALELLRDARDSRWADIGDVEALARSLTAAGAAKAVAVASAKDAAQLAVGVGKGFRALLLASPLLLLAAGAFLLWRWSPRA